MNTWIQMTHQGAILAQSFAAALAMLGMGLAGETANQELRDAAAPLRHTDSRNPPDNTGERK